MKTKIEGEYKVITYPNGTVVRELNRSAPKVPKKVDKVKTLLAKVDVKALENSDIGKAVKALLIHQGLL